MCSSLILKMKIDKYQKSVHYRCLQKNSDSDSYTIQIKNLRLFRLCIRFIACGSTIRLSTRLVQATKEETNLAYLGGASEKKVRQYVRAVVAISLQNISDAMKFSWTYSAAFDASTTHQSISYLDVRLRICRNSNIQTYHLMALPMFERHTGRYMFEIFAKLFDVLDGNWRDK